MAGVRARAHEVVAADVERRAERFELLGLARDEPLDRYPRELRGERVLQAVLVRPRQEIDVAPLRAGAAGEHVRNQELERKADVRRRVHIRDRGRNESCAHRYLLRAAYCGQKKPGRLVGDGPASRWTLTKCYEIRSSATPTASLWSCASPC